QPGRTSHRPERSSASSLRRRNDISPVTVNPLADHGLQLYRGNVIAAIQRTRTSSSVVGIVRLWLLVFVPFAVLPIVFLSGKVVPDTALWGPCGIPPHLFADPGRRVVGALAFRP